MDTNPLILIVDDDRDIRELTADYLNKNGLRTALAADGIEMARQLERLRVDLVVLDIMMPGEDGLSLCRRLRVGSRLPVILLTARGEAIDRILGLEMGADDYLTKPFEPRELLARIKSVLRRTQALPANLEPEPRRRLRFAGWTLDRAARQLRAPDGVLVALSSAELRLLNAFVEHPRRVLNRDQLLNLTAGRDAEPLDRSIDILVSRLRQKLRDDARAPALLKTVRNEGYSLAAEVEVLP
ncbi:MAG: response regulator [Gammaproteobacteria bacterium]|nr:response regulator [Gammaproteobacteria bacterium]